MKICVLASSSAGNCTFISTERTRVLVDAGICRREIVARLAAIGEEAARLDAVLITHEHSDHVSGLIALIRKFRVPVYLTALTAPMILWGDLEAPIEQFQAGSRFRIGDIDVTSFTLPHDAVDPVGFTFEADGAKAAVATDLGYMPSSVRYHLRDTNFLVLESNHDLDMLKVGPYPWSVKQRVMGRRGHLSNDVVCEYIYDDVTSSLQTLLLGHLSEQNNHPEIVRLGSARAMERRSLAARLIISQPREASGYYDVIPAKGRAFVAVNGLLPF